MAPIPECLGAMNSVFFRCAAERDLTKEMLAQVALHVKVVLSQASIHGPRTVIVSQRERGQGILLLSREETPRDCESRLLIRPFDKFASPRS